MRKALRLLLCLLLAGSATDCGKSAPPAPTAASKPTKKKPAGSQTTQVIETPQGRYTITQKGPAKPLDLAAETRANTPVYNGKVIDLQGGPFTFTGEVVDADGKPLAAEVAVYEMQITNRNRYHIVSEKRMQTDDEGRFRFSAKPTGPGLQSSATVMVSKESFCLRWASWGYARDRRMVFRLGEPKRVAGVVVDPAGAPVAGAEVSAFAALGAPRAALAFGLPGMPPLRTTTDTEGRFAFDRLPEDATIEFGVVAAGWASQVTFRPKTAVLQYRPGMEDIRIALGHETRFEGTVLKPGSKEPAEGVKVAAWRLGAKAPYQYGEDITDGEGRYDIGGMSPGNYVVEAVSDPTTGTPWASSLVMLLHWGRPKPKVRTIRKAAIHLIQPSVIEIAVTDEDKTPIKGATAQLRASCVAGYVMRAATGADGIARFHVAGGVYNLGGVQAAGYSYRDKGKQLQLGRGMTRRFLVKLVRSRMIAGIVRDPDGRPLAGATVGLHPGHNRSMVTDANGAFELAYNPREDMAEAACYLVARHVTRLLAAVEEIPADARNVEITLAPGVTVTGMVRDDEDNPLAGTTIYASLRASGRRRFAWRTGATTDAKGRYTLKCLPAPHDCRVDAYPRRLGVQSMEHRLEPSPKGTVALPPFVFGRPAYAIAGVVVDEDHKPVAEAIVTAEAGMGRPERRAYTNRHGKFKIDGLTKGETLLAARSENGRMIGNMQNAVPGLDRKVLIVLHPQPYLEGLVVDPDGKPAQRVLIVVPSGYLSRTPITTDGQGKFEVPLGMSGGISSPSPLAPARRALDSVLLRPSPPGAGMRQRVMVVARRPSRNLAAVEEVTLKPRELSVKMRLKPAVTLNGVVVTSGGNPIAGALVYAHMTVARYSMPLHGAEVKTDANGRYTIPAVPRGYDYMVMAYRGGYGQGQSKVTLARDTPSSLMVAKVVLPKADLTITGVVVDEKGTPVPGAHVSAHANLGTTAEAETDAAGKFMLKNLCEGTAKLIAVATEGNLLGILDTEAGSREVKIVLAKRPGR